MERQKIIAFLTDVRSVILKSLGAVVIAGIISFIYAKDIIKLLLKTADLQVYYLSLPEVFFTTVELALYGGVFFALPIIIYLTWRKLKGALGIKPIYGYLFIFFAIVLFYGGSLFCYRFVLPSGIKFLLSYEGVAIRAMISVERFVLFCAAMIFAFGITFEIPIIMMVLGKTGIVKSQSLSKHADTRCSSLPLPQHLSPPRRYLQYDASCRTHVYSVRSRHRSHEDRWKKRTFRKRGQSE